MSNQYRLLTGAFPSSLIIAVLGLVFFLTGCNTAPTTQPTSLSDRQDQMLRNPMSDVKWDNPDISGGGINDFHRNSFDKDVDHVLNP